MYSLLNNYDLKQKGMCENKTNKTKEQKMTWTFGLLDELKELVGCIEALENGYYDTHNLDRIGSDRENIENRIRYLTGNLPVEGTQAWDYEWDFNRSKLVHLKGND